MTVCCIFCQREYETPDKGWLYWCRCQGARDAKQEMTRARVRQWHRSHPEYHRLGRLSPRSYERISNKNLGKKTHRAQCGHMAPPGFIINCPECYRDKLEKMPTVCLGMDCTGW